MAKSVLVDAGFVVALLGHRDAHHAWAVAQVPRFAPPWTSCGAVAPEAFHLLGARGLSVLGELLRWRKLILDFNLDQTLERVLGLIEKYPDVPMSLADAWLVRMTEIHADSVLVTTDTDFHICRRHGRQIVPCVLPR